MQDHLLHTTLKQFKERSLLFSSYTGFQKTRSILDGHCVGHVLQEDVHAGYLTTKVECLIQSLLNYRDIENIRCIIFVERVVTAIVIKSLLCTVPQLALWEMSYLVGNNSGWHNQSRHEHLSIVESFRLGRINIIVSTQVLEEGLDVQSCNLVIRFDPSPTVCSFIQSRGRARMQGSDYLLIVRRDDSSTLLKVTNYLTSGCMMRKEALELSSLPCSSLNGRADEEFYCVGKTGAIVALSSSVPLIYFYCSRLPSDRYFKPTPRFLIDDELNSCTLLLPKNCPLPSIFVENVSSNIKQIVCLEACKKLHQCGALNDYLLPLVDMEGEIPTPKLGYSGPSEHHDYFPRQLVDSWSAFSVVGLYHSYRISLTNSSHHRIFFRDIIFVVKEILGSDFIKMNFDLDSEWGVVSVNVEYLGLIRLKPDEVMMAKTFQTVILSIIIRQKVEVLNMVLEHIGQWEEGLAVTYLILPSLDLCKHPYIDWKCTRSESFLQVDMNLSTVHHCSARTCRRVLMKNGLVNSCVIKDSIVYTPHSKAVYLISDLNGVNGYSDFKLRSGEVVTYQKFYQTRHGIDLCHPEECFLSGQHIFPARNYLSRKVFMKKKDSNFHSVALPPELCQIVLSPVDVRTVLSFSFLPSIMYRIENLLLAARVLKLDNLLEHVTVPAVKVLEAITTKRCREKFSLESLETLGDSFLKYVATVHLYRNKNHHHEGILSIKRDQIISNAALYDLACSKKLPGFVRTLELSFVACLSFAIFERDTGAVLIQFRDSAGFVRTLEFDPKSWKIPGACHVFCIDNQLQSLDSKHVVSKGSRYMKSKVISDAVEALIGVSLSVQGERKTLLFLQWLGISVKCGQDIPNSLPLLHKSEMLVNVHALESILKYKFHNSSLLVEALTHGSFQIEGKSRCYQLLEFLGDAVLDYLITTYMYEKYPGIAPGLLTDLRSASVNNDCYAHAAVKVGLNKHVLHASTELHRQIEFYIANIQSSPSCASYGWDAGSALPKVLGDVIESLAGAIFVDSGYNKETVWQSMRPLLEPLVTPETIEYHPVRKLKEICAHKLYECNYLKVIKDGLTSVTVEIAAGPNKIRETKTAINKKTAKKLAAKAALENLRTLGL